MWRPIETAPKDGTEIVFTDGKRLCLGKWAGRALRWAVATYGGDFGIGTFTHWMPLPDPPGEEYAEIRRITPEEIADLYRNPNPGEPTAREHLEAFKRARDKWDDPVCKATAECHAIVFMEDHAERLLRTAPEPQSGETVEVRIAVAVDAEGLWDAAGSHGLDDDDVMAMATKALAGTVVRESWITAHVPLPGVPAEVPGVVAAEMERRLLEGDPDATPPPPPVDNPEPCAHCADHRWCLVTGCPGVFKGPDAPGPEGPSTHQRDES